MLNIEITKNIIAKIARYGMSGDAYTTAFCIEYLLATGTIPTRCQFVNTVSALIQSGIVRMAQEAPALV